MIESDLDGSEWHYACAVGDLTPGEALVVERDEGEPIALFNVDGQFYATSDTCTHSKSSLSEDGYLDGAVVECALHFASFCVRTGAVLGPPANGPLETYPVVVRDGRVHVSNIAAAPSEVSS
ncbi:bifunctional 3-phenylpropionate/cinnamic acid dioxygenase ferredoxin subunit [Rhodococcus sp. NPDC055024]